MIQNTILTPPNPSGLVLGFTLAILTGLFFQFFTDQEMSEPSVDDAVVDAVGSDQFQDENIEVSDRELDAKFIQAVGMPDTSPESLQRILKQGASIAARDKEGWTPLMVAVSHGQPIEIIQFLIDKGANIEARSNSGFTPLMFASPSYKIFATEIVAFLIKYGADIEARDHSGRTPLMLAVETAYSPSETAQFLIDKGARIEVRANDGSTPLMIAARYSDIEKIQLLIDNGAKIGVTNNDGSTPLMLAGQNISHSGHAIVNFLLEKGAKIDARNNHGSTPLMFAARNAWSPENAQLLLDMGAEIDATNNDGWTALMFAANFSPPDGYIAQSRVAISPDLIVQLLLDKGADAVLRSKEGKKAIDYADLNPKLRDNWTYWNLHDNSDMNY